MREDNSELKEILEGLDIESYVDFLGVDYRRTTGSSGPQINIRECPRCGGRKWKVFLNAETGLGNCFHGDCADEPGFNIYTFTRYHLDAKTGREVAEKFFEYAKGVGWRPKRKKRTTVAVAPVSSSRVRLPDSYALPIRGRNLAYLDKRGFTGDVAEYFEWRFCKEGHFEYESEQGTRKQDYSNRVIIPVRDLNGEIMTFQGRDITGEAEKKYLFPPGLPGSGRFLYNGFNAIGAEEVVIGEGVFDVAAIKLALDEDKTLVSVVPIGTFGKHLSYGSEEGNDQLGRLLMLKEKGLKRVTFMWDGERKALDDACKAALQVRKIGLEVRVAVLPKDKDPNEVSAREIRKAYYDAFAVNMVSVNKFRAQQRLAVGLY